MSEEKDTLKIYDDYTQSTLYITKKGKMKIVSDLDAANGKLPPMDTP